VKLFLRIVLALVIVVLLAVAGIAVFVASRQNLRFDAPEPAVTASSDSAVIARGRYVVRDVGACTVCHGAPSALAAYMAGEDVPLSGGFAFKIPPGEFYVANITPDPETGIGRISDGKIARALRFGVGHDGRALLPFMEMQGLSDEDLSAVVSYLRSQPPVPNPVPAHHFNMLGKVLKATVFSNPIGPKQTPPRTSPRGATVENGAYLAGSIAICWACHTQRDPNTGQLTNALYSGNNSFTDDVNPKRTWAPPNLTSAPRTGVLARLDEDAFVTRMRAGRAIPGSPMPWQGYQRMSEEDLRAIYRFLETLPPVENDVGPVFVDKP
jgi:mono/diheme cytochrome c family protein